MISLSKASLKIFPRLAVFFGCFSFLIIACAHAQDPSLKKVSFIPLWKPQAQFAGYYVAYEKGIYRKHGLDVEIKEGGPGAAPADMLNAGRADFGVMWLSSAVRWRGNGVPLVNIGQVLQRSALMFVARRSSGIGKPEDLQGRKVSIWEGDLQLQPKAFLRKYGLAVEPVVQSYTVNLFLMGGVDAACAMWYNEYNILINAGIDEDELTVFRFSEHGLNFPEDGIYCLESVLEKDPEAAAAFVDASFEGWRYAFDHPREAVEIVLKYMRRSHIPANRVHQEWMLARMRDLMGGGVWDRGVKRDDFERVRGEVAANGMIKGSVAYEDIVKVPGGGR